MIRQYIKLFLESNNSEDESFKSVYDSIFTQQNTHDEEESGDNHVQQDSETRSDNPLLLHSDLVNYNRIITPRVKRK